MYCGIIDLPVSRQMPIVQEVSAVPAPADAVVCTVYFDSPLAHTRRRNKALQLMSRCFRKSDSHSSFAQLHCVIEFISLRNNYIVLYVVL